MAFHLEAQSVLKLRDLLASNTLSTEDTQLALSLLYQQLHKPEKAVECVEASVMEICVMLLRGSGDALVRERAGRVVAGLVRVPEGSARLAQRTLEGDGVLALAEACEQDSELGVRRSCAAALRSYTECGGREAPRVLAREPAALQQLAEGVLHGGCGEEAVRALAAVCALQEGAAAALTCPSMVPALVAFLEQAVAQAEAEAAAPPRHTPAPPHCEPPSLPCLAALRGLCVLDAGKAAAAAGGAPAQVCASLAHPAPAVRGAAASCLALMAQNLSALTACLEPPPGCEDGPSRLASLLMPLLLDPATRMASFAAVQTVCGSTRGRAAVLAWAAYEGGPEGMRLLCRCHPSELLAGELFDMLKSPLCDGLTRAAVLAGLQALPVAVVDSVAFARDTLAACPEEAAAALLAALR